MQLDSQSQITACCLLLSEVIKTGRLGCHRISQIPPVCFHSMNGSSSMADMLMTMKAIPIPNYDLFSYLLLTRTPQSFADSTKAAFWTVLFPWDRDVLKSIKALGTEWSAPLRNCLTFMHALLCNKNGRRLPSSPKKVSDWWVWFQNSEKERKEKKKKKNERKEEDRVTFNGEPGGWQFIDRDEFIDAKSCAEFQFVDNIEKVQHRTTKPIWFAVCSEIKWF